jgi:NADH:ubiquinone oxidoreductase subunit 3 (subunit A)
VYALRFLSFFVSTNFKILDREKVSGYECGFEPYFESFNRALDIKFFRLAILFIIFDIEIMFFFPWVITLKSFIIVSLQYFYNILFFLLVFLIGFLFEYNVKVLEIQKEL